MLCRAGMKMPKSAMSCPMVIFKCFHKEILLYRLQKGSRFRTLFRFFFTLNSIIIKQSWITPFTKFLFLFLIYLIGTDKSSFFPIFLLESLELSAGILIWEGWNGMGLHFLDRAFILALLFVFAHNYFRPAGKKGIYPFYFAPNLWMEAKQIIRY